jgi:hypothetical protein
VEVEDLVNLDGIGEADRDEEQQDRRRLYRSSAGSGADVAVDSGCDDRRQSQQRTPQQNIETAPMPRTGDAIGDGKRDHGCQTAEGKEQGAESVDDLDDGGNPLQSEGCDGEKRCTDVESAGQGGTTTPASLREEGKEMNQQCGYEQGNSTRDVIVRAP